MGPGDAQLPRLTQVRLLRGESVECLSITDRSDRHYTNQKKWLRRDFGDKLPSDVFREHSLACYVTDKTSLKLRHEIGIPTSSRGVLTTHAPDCFWPDAPEQVLAELNAAGASDSDIDKITWQNSAAGSSAGSFAASRARRPKALRAKGATTSTCHPAPRRVKLGSTSEAARQA